MSRTGNNGRGYADADMFDVSGFVRLVGRSVRAYRLTVLWTCVATLALVTLYVWIWPPIYRVEARLAVERDLDPARDTFYSNWQVFRKDDPRDEIELFTAGQVLRDVIAKNKLTYDDVYHPFLTHAGYVWEKSLPGRAYKAAKDLVFPDPDAPSPELKELGRTMDGLKDGVRISGVADTHVATLEVMGPNRHVTEVANSLIDSYLEYRKRRHESEARKAFDILTKEAEQARIEMEKVSERREAFARKHGLMVEFQKESLDVKELTGLETNITNESSKIASLEASLRETDVQLNGEKAEKVLSSTKESNPVLQNAKLKRLELQTTLIGLRARYREDSPEVKEALSDLANVEALIASEPEKVDQNVTQGVNTVHQQLISNRDQLQSELKGTRAAVATMKETADLMRTRLRGLPGVMSTALDLNREYDVAAEKYKRLLFRRMEADVSATALEAAPGTVKVVDYALPPSSKYWPRYKYLYPGALVMGLALGCVAAVLRSLTSRRLLQDHFDSGRIAMSVYATIDIGGRAPAIKVVPRRHENVGGGGSDQPKVV